ncbi:acetyltransferase [Pasteurellaceae bacterium RH1A]|nr:acetyltransferase [Pasteurellaceae bacterium RH1A]
MQFTLEKFTDTDFDDYFKLVSNIDVMAMITERALSEAEARADFAQLLSENSLHSDLGHFKIIEHSGKFMGLAKLCLLNKNSLEAELGYMLLPLYWRQGIGSQVANQLLNLAKQKAELNGLFAIIDPKNLASRKILEKLGFQHKEFKDFDGLPGEILTLNFS